VILLAEQILRFLEITAVGISLFAVAVIIVGFIVAAWHYLHQFRETNLEQNFTQFKIELGSVLLLGLEILVLADVIETITVTPTFHSLAELAAIIVIRTAVSWALTLETEGRWPWQADIEGKENA
jgi:uncharacterized membrane protein